MADPSAGGTDQAAVDELVDLLDLERIEVDIFRGVSPASRQQRVFGGQVAGQALIAAGRTVDDDRHVHSLHSYFIRPGDPSVPIVYEVDRVRDGRSFSTRRVAAIQHGKAIFTLSASFQLEQHGVEHQPAMPDVPMPEDLPTMDERMSRAPAAYQTLRERPRPIELRYVEDPWKLPEGPGTAVQSVWMRANGRLPDNPLLHVCVLTYASDLTLLNSVLVRQGLSHERDRITMASLDHAMWFLRPFRMDEWVLYAMKSPAAANSRGLATGRFHSRNGEHLVSVVQEGMIRVG
jgi:acyl-CoA thioesterase-2